MEKCIFPIDESIKNHQLKTTTTRKKVYELLYTSNVPLTAENLYFQLRENGINTNLSTVYRTLESFVAKKIIMSLNVEGEKKVFYEFVREHHRHYLICLGCNKIISLEYCPLENYEKELESQSGFTLTSHRLILYGYCPECKTKHPELLNELN